jgi:site-specific recombinase XerD
VPHVDALKHLRDRALLGLLGLQALRTVEITRANVDDLQRHGDNWALLVHGKYHDRLVFLRPDVADALRAYLAARQHPARRVRRGVARSRWQLRTWPPAEPPRRAPRRRRLPARRRR